MRIPTVLAALAVLVGIVPSLLAQQTGGLSQLAWFDRGGALLGTLGPVGDIGNIELSPDGRRVAVALLDPARGTRDLWLYDVATGRRDQLTSTPADENWLVWSPDGRRVAFNSFGRTGDLLVGPVDDVPSAGVAFTDDEGKWPVSWSPDGRTLLVVKNAPGTGNDIWVLPLGGAPSPLLRTPAAENWAAFAPDGRWIAYSASDSGVVEVYVMPFPATGTRWKVSVGGGSGARWRRDGREIFYIAPDRRLMAVPIGRDGDELAPGAPQALFQTRYPYPPFHSFDVTADGQRFLVNTQVVSPTAPGVIARR